MRAPLRSARSGYTLLEMVVSLTIFSVLCYSVFGAMLLSHRTHAAVTRKAEATRTLRRASTELQDELRSANRDTIEVTLLPDGNDRIEFMLPVTVGGNPEWGVSDATLTEAQAGWTVCYTVEALEAAGGGRTRQLVRMLIDDEDFVQRRSVVATGLRDGAVAPRGFGVVEAGDLWEVTLTYEGETENASGRSGTFHVRTRN